MRITILLLLGFASVGVRAGETCKYVDAEGRITFANVPVKHARKVLCFDPVPTMRPAPKQVAAARPGDTTAPSPGAKVDAGTQRQRDTERRRILEREIEDEQRMLEQALRSLQQNSGGGADTSPATVLERSRPLLEAVNRHERNIEAIRREMATIR